MLDAGQLRHLTGRDGGIAMNCRTHIRVNPQHHTAGFQAVKQIVDIGRHRTSFHHVGLAGNRLLKKVDTGLGLQAIEKPGIAWHDPTNRLWLCTGSQQPAGRVHPGLASANDHKMLWDPLAALPQMRQFIQRYKINAGLNSKLRLVSRRNRGPKIGGVDSLLADLNLGFLARQQGHKPAVPFVIRHGKILDATARQQALVHHLLKIATDFGARRKLIETLINPRFIDAIMAKRQRIHPIKGGRLVQGYKAIGIVPMPSGLTMTINDGDMGISLCQQCIGKGKTNRPCPNNQIIGFHDWPFLNQTSMFLEACVRFYHQDFALALKPDCASRTPATANTVSSSKARPMTCSPKGRP